MNIKFFLRTYLVLAFWAHAATGMAGIQVGGTRVIFPATQQEAALQVRNQGTDDIMIQSWIEAMPNQAESDVPFAITPSLARLGHRKEQTLRIFYQGVGLPQDRESVMWLNVQEIPQVSTSENSLQIAIRQRLKLFYRPKDLPGTADEAARNLTWSVENASGSPALLASNGSAFHVSFGKVSIVVDEKEYEVAPSMVAPQGTERMTFTQLPATLSGDAQVHWESINDYGGLVKHQALLRF